MKKRATTSGKPSADRHSKSKITKRSGTSCPTKKQSSAQRSSEANSPKKEKIIVHTDKSEDTRINKYISETGFCSRREADKLVEQGRVTINGVKAGMGDRVLPGQAVKVNGQLIAGDEEMVYIAFNKPVGITSTTDRKDKSNIIDYISHEKRIFPIGRLDKDSQGLILLTNDGDIVNKILRAGNNHEKEYIVTVNKPITESFVKRMASGVPILGVNTRKCVIEKLSENTFIIILKQGLNRQIRRMCEYFGYEVTKLKRIRIMNIELNDLKEGQWRNLRKDEMIALNNQIQKSAKDTNKRH
ncbi:23S rRNA pseudouridine(2604) synthase RluF [Acetobacteroides hydrogenigenes]|uniref:Pseudouridine synthase n=1 Tax=Acetobacteroides hydrogenigenes TaxID=979970 RepID=A0A4R2F0S8_9BACT|nr:23S rRNA pseudouridine(2604) synthase RluF [Acetobacteroides hydrogenigenes]TCN70579.1 23S rRNA pseudouridine2604 synthase [Acetobacteroides hydrogenigenes]